MKVLVIEKENIRHNIEIILKRAEGVPVYGVLKGDAYGLGLTETARMLRDWDKPVCGHRARRRRDSPKRSYMRRALCFAQLDKDEIELID
jgi:hypothetical protein